MTTRIVGLDIGTDALRAVEVENPQGPAPRVVRSGALALPPGSTIAGEVKEVQTVASAIRRLWSTAGFRTRRVALGVGNSRVFVRDLTVPRLPLAQIREALPFQVQDMLPVPVSDALLDFYPAVESDGENGPMVSGLLIAALRDPVRANVDAARFARLDPAGVDLIPFALSRRLAPPGNPETVALIDIGGSTTNVVIVPRGVPAFVRSIPTGGDDLTRAIGERFGLAVEQAEHVKVSLGMARTVAREEHKQVVQVIYDWAGELINGLRNTLGYFASLPSHEPVGRVLLTGGGARLTGLAEALADVLGVRVEHASPLHGIGVSRGSLPADPGPMTLAVSLAVGSAA